MFERIVAGYAGDRAGRDAVVLATQLALACGGQLSIVFPYHPLLSTVPADVAEERVRGELDALVDGPAPDTARLRWSNASWPIRALHELAEFEEAELIVFGAAPERLERRHVALMERMVNGAPCAIAVAPPGYADDHPASVHRLGIGFADTTEGRGALRLGRDLARALEAEAKILAGGGLTPSLQGYAALSPALAQVERELLEETKAAAQRARDELPGEQMQLDVRGGDPCRMLLEGSGELDLLILGSRAYGPLRHVLLGSVSAEVMRSAKCPVLVLPRQISDAGGAEADPLAPGSEAGAA